jgi:hypothetical protein
MHYTQGMIEPGMDSPRIDQVGKGQLADAPQSLQSAGSNKVHVLFPQRDKIVDGVSKTDFHAVFP